MYFVKNDYCGILRLCYTYGDIYFKKKTGIIIIRVCRVQFIREFNTKFNAGHCTDSPAYRPTETQQQNDVLNYQLFIRFYNFTRSVKRGSLTAVVMENKNNNNDGVLNSYVFYFFTPSRLQSHKSLVESFVSTLLLTISAGTSCIKISPS